MPHMLRLRDYTVRELFADVVRNSGSAVARTSFVLGLLSYLLKRKAVTIQKTVPSSDERYGKLNAMKTYVESHLDRRIDLTNLAETIGMDRTSVIRIFARYLHQTPHRYIMHRRMETAQQLLAEGCPVQVAARRTGFPDSTSFVKSFKAAFHATREHIADNIVL